MAHLGVVLLQSSSPVARLGDTLVIKQLAPDHGVLDQILTFSTAFIMLCLVAMVVILVIAAMKMRGVAQKTTQALNKVYADLGPIIKTAGSIAENVNAMSASIRKDVDKVSTTVTAANDQVRQTIAMTEKRINELNALLSVVQSEAERLFISTASTVRGVQTGAATFGRRDGMDFASDELDAGGADPAEEIEILEGEEDDGNDGNSESTAAPLPAAPRVRPRTRDRRGA